MPTEFFLNKLKEEWGLVKQTPYSFVIAVLITALLLGSLIWWFIDYLYNARVQNQASNISNLENRVADLKYRLEISNTHEAAGPDAPKLEVLDKAVDGDTVKIIVKVISQYSPNYLELHVFASSIESASIDPMGQVMQWGQSQPTPTHKIFSIKNPNDKYMIIIKTKAPDSVVLRHKFG